MSNPVKSLPIRTSLRTGNAVSDKCYATRNWANINAFFGLNPYYNEKDLKYCLSLAGEPKWYKDFGMEQQEACELTRDNIKEWSSLTRDEKQQKLVEMDCDKLVKLNYSWG